MDNTLFDFVAAKLHACQHVAAFIGKTDGEKLFEYFLLGKHGFEDHKNIRDYLLFHRCFDEKTFSACITIYQREKLSVLAPYPGIHHILEELHRKPMKMAILTDAHRDNALPRLERMNMKSYFDYIVTTDMTGMKKPSLEPFRLALHLLETEAKETLLIGDSIRRDIAPGKILGMITAYARYGDRNIPTSVTCIPDIIFDSAEDIALLLPRMNGKGAP